MLVKIYRRWQIPENSLKEIKEWESCHVKVIKNIKRKILKNIHLLGERKNQYEKGSLDDDMLRIIEDCVKEARKILDSKDLCNYAKQEITSICRNCPIRRICRILSWQVNGILHPLSGEPTE